MFTLSACLWQLLISPRGLLGCDAV